VIEVNLTKTEIQVMADALRGLKFRDSLTVEETALLAKLEKFLEK
jgi:hypothetical protein